MFGELDTVRVFSEEQYALITFKDIMCAFYAQQSLNNIYLKKYNVNLLVKWIPREQQQVQGRQGTTLQPTKSEIEPKVSSEEAKENSPFNS